MNLSRTTILQPSSAQIFLIPQFNTIKMLPTSSTSRSCIWRNTSKSLNLRGSTFNASLAAVCIAEEYSSLLADSHQRTRISSWNGKVWESSIRTLRFTLSNMTASHAPTYMISSPELLILPPHSPEYYPLRYRWWLEQSKITLTNKHQYKLT